MDANTDDMNLLWELAQTMADQDSYPAAIALRKLVQAGFTNLQEIDAASDWVLLATPGIGIGRLAAVRRLISPDWQPPSARALKAAERFLSAARFARRFWPAETLEALVQGTAPSSVHDGPVEKRLALEMFSQATRKALSMCDAEELLRALRQGDDSLAGAI